MVEDQQENEDCGPVPPIDIEHRSVVKVNKKLGDIGGGRSDGQGQSDEVDDYVNIVSKARQADTTQPDHAVKSKSSVIEAKHQHLVGAEGLSAKMGIFCPHCPMRFESLKAKEMHALIEHSYEQPFKCKECSMRFKLKEEIMEHSSLHGRGRFQIQCEICDKVFYSLMLYFSHYKIHSNLKEFECTQCGKSFYTYKNLKKHADVHKPKKFSCIVCGKLFHRQYELKKHHERLHLK